MNPGWFTCAKPCPQKLTLSFYLPCERITHSNWQRRRAEPVRGRLATVRGRVQLKFPSHSPPAGSHHAQCFPVRGFFSGAISQGQSCVINRNRACRHRSLVQSAIVATGPPPEEPTVRTALTVMATSLKPSSTRPLTAVIYRQPPGCNHSRRYRSAPPKSGWELLTQELPARSSMPRQGIGARCLCFRSPPALS